GRWYGPGHPAAHALPVSPPGPARPRRARSPAVLDGERCPAGCRRTRADPGDAEHPAAAGGGVQQPGRGGGAVPRRGCLDRCLSAHGADRPAARGRAGAALMVTASALPGATLGLAFGLGLVLIGWRVSARRVRLIDRVSPYLRERPSTSRLLRSRPAHT